MTSDSKVPKGERLYVRPNKKVNEMTPNERSDFANAVADMFAAQMKKSQESSPDGNDINTDQDQVSERKNEMNVSEDYAIWGGGETWIGKVDGGGSNLPPVLIVNGGPGATHNYCSIAAEALAELGHTVYLYDQVGSGNSVNNVRVDVFTHETYLEELEAVTAHVGHGYVLLGHSYGSSLAMDFAASPASSGLIGLVLCSGAASMPQWIESINQRRSEMPEAIQRTARMNELAGTFDTPEYDEALRYYDRRYVCRTPISTSWLDSSNLGPSNDVAYRTMWGPAEFYVDGTLRNWDMTFRLKDIKVPSLILTGRYDNVTSELTDHLVKRIPNARKEVFEESSSLIFHEETAKFQRVVDEFLRHI